jgi:IS30 family transposase
MVRDDLVAYVIDKLRAGWTPQSISGRLRREHPDDPGAWVSPETIYAWVYAAANKHRALWEYLPRGRRKRRKRGGRRVHSSRIDRRRSISERSGVANDRTQFGHWEGDSVMGVRGGPVLHTEVERKTRFLDVRKVISTTAEAAVAAQLAIFGRLPAGARRSVTTDNGTEFHYHYKVADALRMDTFFADPYSSWQRGTNEHFNGRLRRYLPKRTDFATITATELAAIVAEINDQPRKILGWATPAEAFAEHLRLEQATTVALQI